jgi:dolichol-phosphate mannosyltransferase
MPKRVILTGGTGFVGANLCRRLLRDGHEVHLLVRPDYHPWRIEAVRSDLRLHEIHLIDKETLTREVDRIRPDWVFHLAAYGAYSSQNDLQQMVETNFTGTINLVEACLASGFEGFVHAGSSSEYGFKDHAPAETELPEPNSHYAVTKASATLFCRYTARARDANLTTLRLYSVYGPYEEPTRLIPTLALRGREGRLPPLVDPDIARDFVDVEDVAEAFCLAAARSGGERGAVYNVGTGVQTSLRRVVEVARQTLSVGNEPQWGTMPDRHWDTRVWVSDPRKIRNELGWEPRTGFEEGFRRFVDWLQQHPAILALYRKRCVLPS